MHPDPTGSTAVRNLPVSSGLGVYSTCNYGEERNRLHEINIFRFRDIFAINGHENLLLEQRKEPPLVHIQCRAHLCVCARLLKIRDSKHQSTPRKTSIRDVDSRCCIVSCHNASLESRASSKPSPCATCEDTEHRTRLVKYVTAHCSTQRIRRRLISCSTSYFPHLLLCRKAHTANTLKTKLRKS